MLTLAALVIATAAQCAPYAEVDAYLRSQYGEQPAEPTVMTTDAASVFYAGPTTWTLVIVGTDRTACMVAAGRIVERGQPS